MVECWGLMISGMIYEQSKEHGLPSQEWLMWIFYGNVEQSISFLPARILPGFGFVSAISIAK